MPLKHLRRAAGGLVAVVAVCASVSPAGADPIDPIPGNGFFLVGPDIAPGLYRTGGSASPFGIWINDVPTQDSRGAGCPSSTPATNKDHVVATNMSIGPMFANINSTVQAFESRNCQPWTRVT